jgi:hypothetical protein
LIEIFNVQKNRQFTYAEAEEILPLVYRITDDSSKEVKYLMGCVEALQDKHADSSRELQTRINQIIEKWQNKLERLGLRPKGLWLADFDNGSGYFCWKFPETKISFQHGYQDGFTGRILISEQDAPCEDHHAHSPISN